MAATFKDSLIGSQQSQNAIELKETKPKEFHTFIVSQPRAADSHTLSSLRAQSTESPENEKLLPPMKNVVLIIINNFLSCVSFNIVIPISAEYSRHLGGTSSFSGIIIGTPTIVALLLLYPMLKFSLAKNGRMIYKRPIIVCAIGSILGHVLYSLADYVNWLYLILISRLFFGVACTMFLYHKRYVTDKTLVSPRYRTPLATCTTLAQAMGMCVGPFLGGLLSKASAHARNRVWDKFTSGNWIMAIVWLVYLIVAAFLFKDDLETSYTDTTVDQSVITDADQNSQRLTKNGMFTMFVVSWITFTSNFTLVGYLSSIPVYTSELYGYSTFQAGNFIALNFLLISPLVLSVTFLSRHIQDRIISLGSLIVLLFGLFLHLIIHECKREYLIPYFIACLIILFSGNVVGSPSVSLLTKQLPPKFHVRGNVAVQIAISLSDTLGAIFGGAISAIKFIPVFLVCFLINALGMVFLLCIWTSIKQKVT
ncbi:membrane transporter [Schizosaccharomyces japonicus yFS275]|uniref:Membrane transporter n=1 Tax=Schizosaccharomyces japonicus (strain yFS275 / FY16936) TaxID=402676 RepID=B6JVN0_SCHJY|nr:membrane transporter [Schizosaccharomyces japonicus yFS275]EEB05431.1 membrane transporter [Schizosaccharomyces japonicus yFS275]